MDETDGEEVNEDSEVSKPSLVLSVSNDSWVGEMGSKASVGCSESLGFEIGVSRFFGGSGTELTGGEGRACLFCL